MATWSGWFKASKATGIPLGIRVDYVADLDRLHASGLPFHDYVFFDCARSDWPDIVTSFAAGHPLMWARAYATIDPSERYYQVDLRTAADVSAFLETLPGPISRYSVQLFEYFANRFGGDIVSDDRGVFIEIAQGDQEIVDNASAPFFHGRIDEYGQLVFFEDGVPREVVEIAGRVIRHLRLGRGQYIRGYFEFAVSSEGRICFFDYKTGF